MLYNRSVRCDMPHAVWDPIPTADYIQIQIRLGKKKEMSKDVKRRAVKILNSTYECTVLYPSMVMLERQSDSLQLVHNSLMTIHRSANMTYRLKYIVIVFHIASQPTTSTAINHWQTVVCYIQLIVS